jgi:hypothetical protein
MIVWHSQKIGIVLQPGLFILLNGLYKQRQTIMGRKQKIRKSGIFLHSSEAAMALHCACALLRKSCSQETGISYSTISYYCITLSYYCITSAITV